MKDDNMEEKQNLNRVRISVRNMVEFLLRSGDIDNRVAGAPDKEAMQMGSRIHRKIQRSMGSHYHAEVSLKEEIPCDGFLLQLEGRADGIIDGEVRTIDEIKGVLCDLERIREPIPVHLAQAKCYAYIYAKQQEQSRIKVQMTYCQMESEEIKRFEEQYSFEELKEWFFQLVAAYEKWGKFQIGWREKRNHSIRSVEFPFPYREGQKHLVTSVYKTILRKKKLFIQAPTGVGKTISTVFPAVKAVGEGLGDKIFYLTAKTITRTVSEQAFAILKQKGLQYKVITLTAKEKICFCEEADCNPEKCPYAKGHYDRINDAVFELITSTGELTRETLEQQARKHMVCPFEMSLDVSLWADAVICDYNYVFDPTAHLKRFFSEGGAKDYLFLIDEAHNLVERGREMYSAAICKEKILEVKRKVQHLDAKLAKRLQECNQSLLTLKRECEKVVVYDSVSHVTIKLMNVISEMSRFMEACSDPQALDCVRDLYFEISSFLNIHDCLDEHYVMYGELKEDGTFWVRLYCVNPAVNLQRFLAYGNSVIFFSATLLPIQYYRKLLSVQTDDYAIYADSPFAKEHRLLLLGTDVSTKYTRRGEEMYRRYAAYIAKVVQAQSGNYLAFFPSYRFMEEVYDRFREQMPEITVVMQSQYMSEEAREIFLEEFEDNREETLVGFCVLGGIFSEGIDLAEDKLIGALIVGTGLPQVCVERELLKDYFDRHNMPGFEYAYLYPGLNKVLQAGGRVIRTARDRGAVLLLDDRFATAAYRSNFPREWAKIERCTIREVEMKMKDFWQRPPSENED